MRPSPLAEKCHAHKKNGEPCSLAPMHGKKVCRLHGGAESGEATRGVNSPTWKHGNRSLVPQQLTKQLGHFLGETEWFNLQPRIALYKEQMELLAANEPPEGWSDGVRREMRAMDEQHRRLVETAKKIEHDDAYQVTVAQLKTIFRRIDTFIERWVSDPTEREGLKFEIDMLVAARAEATMGLVLAGEVSD